MNPLFLLYAAMVWAAALDYGLTPDQKQYLTDDPPVSHLVEFEIVQGTYMAPAVELGSLQVALFASVAPVTCSRFLENAGSNYKDSIFHRIVKDFVVQGGGMKMVGEGQVVSVPFERFDDEEFVLTHNKLGRLSMANAGPNTNGCQFFITTGQSASHLDGHHVVFGQLVSGFTTLEAMNNVEVQDSSPKIPVYIRKVSVVDLTLYSVQTDSVSSGYTFLMFFCVVAALCYAVHRRMSRRSLVDLASFKM